MVHNESSLLSIDFQHSPRLVTLLTFVALLFSGLSGCSGGGGQSGLPVLPTAGSLPTSCTSVGAGAGYNCSITVTGGKGPFTWTVSGLPTGLSSSVSADTTTLTISGTAPQAVRAAALRASRLVEATAAATSASVQIGITDAKGRTASLSFTITINALAISTTSLPNGTVGIAYSASVSATGGATPYTWTITGLPTGLSASGSSISGTPTQSGSFTITVKVTDSASTPASVQVTLSLTIAAPPALAISTSSLPGGTAGTAYMATITATGGVTPYTWTITGLPSGITPTSGTPSASISGTTDSVGSFTVTAKVTDSESTPATVSATLSLTIAQAAALVISTTTLPSGTINVAYSQTLAATGGVAPYTWTQTGGTLPAGLALSSGGMISGTPTATGTSSFTVQAADSESPAQTKSATLSITINATAACALSGKQLAFELLGDTSAGVAAMVGSITVASDASLTGALDFRDQSAVSANQSISGSAGSCSDYTVAGTGTLNFTAGGTARTLKFAMRADGNQGFVVESDSSGFSGSGQIQVQTSPSTPLTGSYGFGLEGGSTTAFFIVIGAACTNSSGAVTFLQADIGITNVSILSLTGASSAGTLSAPDANGRITTTSALTYTNGTTVDSTFYNVDGTKAFVLNTGGSYPGGSIPVQAGFLTGKPGSSCLPMGQGGSFSNSSIGNSVFSAQGITSSGTPAGFIGVLNNFNTAGTASLTDDELQAGVGGQNFSAQAVTYSVSSAGLLTLGVPNKSGGTNNSYAYLDGAGIAYLMIGDKNNQGIGFGIVAPQTATTVGVGTYAFGSPIGPPSAAPITLLPVTEVSLTATTITDMATGGSTGNYTCDSVGRCTAPSLSNNVTFGDTSIAFYVGGNTDSATTSAFIVVLQTSAANAQNGMLSH
jgi:Putative Ig domain